MGSIDVAPTPYDSSLPAFPTTKPTAPATNPSSSSKASQLDHLKTLVETSEIISPSSPSWTSNTQIWSIHKNKHPKLCLRPTSISSLSQIVKYLATTSLSWAVRSQGYGNASASDVVISMTAFDSFSFDQENDNEGTVVLGVGQPWRDYYRCMDEVAPEFTIVAPRTPAIGVGGSTLCSGFSWLSHEFGCSSDPANLLDVEAVLLDGTVTWLKGKHDDLLWALRGTEGGFGVCTRFKFRARRYEPQGKIWAGAVLVPRERVAEVAKGLTGMSERDERGKVDPKVAIFVYVMRKEVLAFIGADQDMLVIHAFDALGEEHGRKEFAWALDIEGAIDQTKGNMKLRDVSALQDNIGDLRGTATNFWSPLALSTYTEPMVLSAFEWWNDMLSEPSSVKDQGYLVFELFSCRDNLAGRDSSAWPRPEGFKHMVLLGSGCLPKEKKEGEEGLMELEIDEEELAIAKRYIRDGPRRILGKRDDEDGVSVIPNAMEEWHNKKAIYGDKYDRLREVKRRYDPKNMLGGPIEP